MLLLPLEPGLLEDTIERPGWHVQPAFSCYRDRAGLNRMPKLTATAFGANVMPPIVFEKVNYLADLHVNVLPKTSPNDEVDRRALTENEDALSRPFDYLLTSPKLRCRSNRLLDGMFIGGSKCRCEIVSQGRRSKTKWRVQGLPFSS